MQPYLTMEEKNATLRFDGSIWCNLDIALRNVDQLFRQYIQPTGLTVIEWYILRALYEQDGQHASELASAVGRAATSFTPNLDKLQDKGLIERRPDETDRRAIRIFLTESAHKRRSDILKRTGEAEEQLSNLIPSEDLETFQNVLSLLQGASPE